MRCLCCNNALSDYESTLRHATTGAFPDLCRKCLKEIEVIPTKGRSDLEPKEVEETEWTDLTWEDDDDV